jgi:hypothetical protein
MVGQPTPVRLVGGDRGVVDHHEADGHEERHPVLVQGDEGEHHEEVEVHLGGVTS